MPPTEHEAATADTQPPRRMGRGLFWAMLAVIIMLAGTVAVAMSGWSSAISRADEQTNRAATFGAAADQMDGLRQKVAAVQKDLAEAQAREKVLQTQLADSKASLGGAEDKVSTAVSRANAAEKAAADAEQARGQLQAKLDAVPAAVARSDAPAASPQPASNISAESARSTIAPELPLPGLPPGATPRDYLVVAQQAVREGRGGRAQAALERAETRLLNQASLAGEPEHPASHAGISEIERALDQLGSGDTKAALQTINDLLARH